MNVLGISAYYHDSAAALLVDGAIAAAAHEERFTRKKHDSSFPSKAVEFCLNYSGLTLSQLDAIIFYDKPILKFERLLETYYAYAPRGFKSFLSAIPVWIKEKLFLRKLIRDELAKIEDCGTDSLNILFSEHHLSHAASAFFPSPFDEAAILTIDGVGEWATSTVGHGKGSGITMLKEMRFPHSLGLLYSAFTYFLGFKVNSGEYKLMGLAPYGRHGLPEVKKYKEIIYDNIIELKGDGSVWLNQDYFRYATDLTMVDDGKWQRLFGFPRRLPEAELQPHHCDLALAIQEITEEAVVRMGKTAQALTGSKNLVMAGGVALNCVANSKLALAGVFDNIWVQPAAGDAGGALGAAYAAHYMYGEGKRHTRAAVNMAVDEMQGTYLGPEFSSLDIAKTARRYRAPYTHYDDFDAVAEMTAELLSQGKVIGWFQGRMEWGPRSLGNRSIIGDARDTEMQKRLNLKIKYRESFRPFAPSVLFEDMPEYFTTSTPSPYMLFVADVQKSRTNPRPDNYDRLSLKEKLYHVRSDLPAITHLDYSARIQSVHKETNPRYHKLISKFKEKTGYCVIVNTSFNVRGEPIVCTPEDAYRCFMRTEMDYLVMGNFIFDKTSQRPWQEKKDWKEEFGLD
ncbi:MAG: carbamoyltransferase [Candidatus Magnetominusculus sp. LBB02]|nr:carbamoyltransferase [Candidatus Magnetominusculus sp. LBB02]